MSALRLSLRGLALALTCIVAPDARAQAAPKVDVTGTWIFTVQTEGGGGTPTITLTQTGDSLTGHYSSQLFGELDFKGTVKDGKISFSISATTQGQAVAITYSGAVESADAMKGNVDFGGFGSGTWTAARKKP